MNFGLFTDPAQIIAVPSAANGRIDIVQPPSIDQRFLMYERTAKENKATDYRKGAPIYGKEQTVLSTAFFSAPNVRILQNALRADVYELSNGKFSIPEQNEDQLLQIMDGMFYQYARFDPAKSVREQIDGLNKRVLAYIVPYLYNEAVAYFKYIRDASTLVTPIDRSMRVDRDYKDLVLPDRGFFAPV